MNLTQKGCNVTPLLFLLTVVCVLPGLFNYINSSDVWFHMACGKQMLNSGTVDVSQFYYTAVNTDIRDFKFTWLGDVILYLVYFMGGAVGLQILRAQIIALILYLMWLVSDRKLNAYKCLTATLVVYGLVQLMVVRNAMFGGLFLCVLWYLHLNDIKHKHVWSIVTLFFWSQMHGSVLLGFCVYAVLAIRSWRSLLLVGLVVFLMDRILPISLMSYFSWPTSYNLNATLFKPSGLISKDFASPFFLKQSCTTIMLFASIMYVVMIKRVRFIYVVMFLATLIPALGYVRMVGYHLITCGMCLMYAERNKDLREVVRPAILVILTCLVGYYGWTHRAAGMGVGVAPTYSSVDGKKLALNVLTQDHLTAYLSFKYGVKGFFSTFHAPHPSYVRDAYQDYMADPDSIDLTINTCIVSDRIYADRFFKSDVWVGSKQGLVYIFYRESLLN